MLKQTSSCPPWVTESLCKREAKRRPKRETMKMLTCSEKEVTGNKGIGCSLTHLGEQILAATAHKNSMSGR